jgi:YHS domain-containing protein
MVKDEYCNTYLPKEESIKKMHQGKEYYFCSEECMKNFLEEKKSRQDSGMN